MRANDDEPQQLWRNAVWLPRLFVLAADEPTELEYEVTALEPRSEVVGVFSLDWESLFGRTPLDDGSMTSAEGAAAVRAAQLLRRSLIVMTHEITHMFGIRHCEYFHCRMMDAYAMDDVLADTDALPAVV